MILVCRGLHRLLLAYHVSSFLFCISIIILVGNVTKDAKLSFYQETYKSLYYQATSNIYDNITENGKAQLAEKITEWNSELASCKRLKKNFWTNIFYPIDYNQLQFIPIELIKREEN